LDENEVLVGSYMMKLNDKYICDIQNHKHCFIKEDRHLPLNNFAMSLWAKEIVCIYIYIANFFKKFIIYCIFIIGKQKCRFGYSS
jgi:hypothetical protein